MNTKEKHLNKTATNIIIGIYIWSMKQAKSAWEASKVPGTSLEQEIMLKGKNKAHFQTANRIKQKYPYLNFPKI